MKPRVYLDTSVISALHDERAPDRRSLTEQFWARRGEFEVSTSEIARIELNQTPDVALRARFLADLAVIPVLAVDSEMWKIAERYIAAFVFTESMRNDALHVAAAVCTGHATLISWNFQHLVNRRRRAAVNALNLAAGLPVIDLISPPEL